MDFLADSLATDKRFRVLTFVDGYTRECPDIEVDRSLSIPRFVKALQRLAFLRGPPQMIVVDSGSEFTGQAMDAWACRGGIQLHFIAMG